MDRKQLAVFDRKYLDEMFESNVLGLPRGERDLMRRRVYEVLVTPLNRILPQAQMTPRELVFELIDLCTKVRVEDEFEKAPKFFHVLVQGFAPDSEFYKQSRLALSEYKTTISEIPER